MITPETMANIIINILLIVLSFAYIIFLALSCSHTFQLMKDTCSKFDCMARDNTNPEKYYPYYIGRSCASTILILKQICLLLPILVAFSIFNKISKIQFNSFFDLFYLIENKSQLLICFVGFAIYFILLVHVLSFNKWLNNKQGESIISTVFETIIKKSI